MPKYIDKDNLLQLFRDSYCGCKAEIAKGRNELDTAFTGYNSCISLAENMPTADVQEVKHGKWLHRCYHKMMGYEFECSVCGRWICANSVDHVVEKYPYCHCGAKIDGVEGLEEN